MRAIVAFCVVLAAAGGAHADEYSDAADLFRNAGASQAYFDDAYGYAIFPTVGKAAFVIGGARGKGRVFVGGRAVGDTTVTELSLGFQAGGQAFSQVIFFQDRRAFEEFSSGGFEFGAGARAVAITAGASAMAGTTGGSAGYSGGKRDAATSGAGYYKGMAVYVIAKAGLMLDLSVSGQKFSYRPL